MVTSVPAAAAIDPVKTVALFTTGRVTPGISALIGFLMRRYSERYPDVKILAYIHGFRGLLVDEKVVIGEKEHAAVPLLIAKGGSPIGGSRVRLTNVKNLEDEELIVKGEDPYEKCAINLLKDRVDVLHVIGSSNSQLACVELQKVVRRLGGQLAIVGLPKTIENDIAPFRLTLGSMSAARAGAAFFNNVVAEYHANPRMLIIHEIKGRSSGWLTAATALAYRNNLDKSQFAPALGLSHDNYDIHAIYTPEMHVDLESEIVRLRRLMDRNGNVNIFVSQGAFHELMEAEAKKSGNKAKTHYRYGYQLIEPGAWLAKRIKDGLKAEKVLVQKSGIFVRAGAASRQDLILAQSTANAAVVYAMKREDGVVGHDEGQGGRLRAVEHSRIVGHKVFNVRAHWFVHMLSDIGQPQDVSLEKLPFFSKL